MNDHVDYSVSNYQLHHMKSINNVPGQLTRLIGRDHEREVAYGLLVRSKTRLLTMTGPGGIGKTRLALAVASDALHAFAGGVCYVSLSSLSDPDLVLPAILQALGIKGMADVSALTATTTFLRGRPLLLVLDNFDQVIDAAPVVLELLENCPDLVALVTSRIVLHIPGEHTFPVSPLEQPNLQHATDTMASCASVDLFVERAQTCQPDFRLTATNMHVVAEICARLDGLPLAIELAAARIQIMSPQMLLSRLKHRLDVLASTSNMRPSRQQTIRKTIQWSYDLLARPKQVLLQRLSVFVASYRLVDIEALYKIIESDPLSVMDDITTLLDSSLIYQTGSEEGEPRFHMLETIREFGLEQLAAEGNLERIRAAHAQYYQALMPEHAAVTLNSPESPWTALALREFDNILASLHYLQECQHYEKALRLASAMGGLWSISGYKSLGVAELTQALDLCWKHQVHIPVEVEIMALTHATHAAMFIPSPLQAAPFAQKGLKLLRMQPDHPLLPVALLGTSIIEYDLGHHSSSDALFEEGYKLFQKSGQQALPGRFFLNSAVRKLYRGQLNEAWEEAERGLAASKAIDDIFITAASLHFLGWIAYCQGANEKACLLGEEAVAIFRTLNFPNWGLEALCVLAYELATLGEVQRSQDLFSEALARSQETGEVGESAHALCGLGQLALLQTKQEKARHLLEESINMLHYLQPITTRYKHVLACALEGLARIAFSQGKLILAARLFGAAGAQRMYGSYYNPIGLEKPLYERVQADICGVLGEKSFARARVEGQCMTPMQVLAAQDLVAIAPVSAHPLAAIKAGQTGALASHSSDEDVIPIESLTKREMDVLRLLAEGQSNAEIAENLALKVVTVNSYLRSVYGKLGVSSRMRAVRCAREHHLLN